MSLEGLSSRTTETQF